MWKRAPASSRNGSLKKLLESDLFEVKQRGIAFLARMRSRALFRMSLQLDLFSPSSLGISRKTRGGISGEIPGRVLSVEFLEVQAAPDHGQTYLYSMYSGAPLRKSISTAESSPTGRAVYLLAQRAAVMP
jgi:hypothetical protein